MVRDRPGQSEIGSQPRNGVAALPDCPEHDRPHDLFGTRCRLRRDLPGGGEQRRQRRREIGERRLSEGQRVDAGGDLGREVSEFGAGGRQIALRAAGRDGRELLRRSIGKGVQQQRHPVSDHAAQQVVQPAAGKGERRAEQFYLEI